MPIFEISDSALVPVLRTTLKDRSISERSDLQRLLRASLAEVLPDTLVISEEFGDWDDSKRRIDLLCIDSKANLVVIELKRGETGSHMELQALRYAAMVSTMTFDQAVSALARSMGGKSEVEARAVLLEFLKWSEPNEEDFAQDVRIVLFSEDFTKELSSSIIWLNNKGLDITCIKMMTYLFGDKQLIDFQQIIPLKEAEEFQIKVREKQQKEQSARRASIPWNGECYANFGNHESRSWDDARKYGFISAGGGSWYTRTLGILTEGDRVWVNQPGMGYLGVGIVKGPCKKLNEFEVETETGMRPYIDVSKVKDELIERGRSPENAEVFVPINWIHTVGVEDAVIEPGLFGNQNSAAKPKTEIWPLTIARLKEVFSIEP
jgi:hypothetical protein